MFWLCFSMILIEGWKLTYLQCLGRRPFQEIINGRIDHHLLSCD